jgi:RimJ/RimL family protein N-acetyltransferase
MYYPSKTITLKDGRSCLFRSPELGDAEEMLGFLRQTAAETHFLLREPVDVTDTLESEQHFIQQLLDSDSHLMIVAEVEGRLAGNCGLNIKTKSKVKHRSEIGLGLLKEFWGLGIGSAMFDEMITAAKTRGCTQMELLVIQGNERGMSLYVKKGFKVVGTIPNAIHLPDGSYLDEYVMVKKL